MSAGAAGVTGQQHAQEFVLECFLRLRRLPRTTNSGGGGLAGCAANSTSRENHSLLCGCVAFNQNVFFDAEFHHQLPPVPVVALCQTSTNNGPTLLNLVASNFAFVARLVALTNDNKLAGSRPF